ncbi:MAG TPA: hypothetical protein VG206_18445 [Terriglobia bacterium]|nr:hypothetical protein [Terriglobia bacterium]
MSDSPNEPDSPIGGESLLDLERRVLAVLCQSGGEGAVRGQARQLLTNYRWSDAAHQAAFEIVMSFPGASCQALRDQLPARLTRRGFPDFDFQALFNVPIPSPSNAEEWMRELAQAR